MTRKADKPSNDEFCLEDWSVSCNIFYSIERTFPTLEQRILNMKESAEYILNRKNLDQIAREESQYFLSVLEQEYPPKNPTVAMNSGILMGTIYERMLMHAHRALETKRNRVCSRNCAKNAREKKLAPLPERNAEIVKKMRDQIKKRRRRRQPTNETIRKKLAEEYGLSLRQIRTITEIFNQEK